VLRVFFVSTGTPELAKIWWPGKFFGFYFKNELAQGKFV